MKKTKTPSDDQIFCSGRAQAIVSDKIQAQTARIREFMNSSCRYTNRKQKQ